VRTKRIEIKHDSPISAAIAKSIAEEVALRPVTLHDNNKLIIFPEDYANVVYHLTDRGVYWRYIQT